MRRFLLSLGLVLGGVAIACAEGPTRDVRLMIGPQHSVVREIREISFTSTVCEVRLEGIPAAADLRTLQLGSEREGVALLGWRRAPVPPGKSGGPVSWRLGEPLATPLPPPAEGDVVCTLQVANLRRRPVEVAYQLEGLAWRAEYEINVRGDIANHLEPLSLDLAGRAVIANRSGLAIPEARLLLVGDRDGLLTSPDASGQLMLDEVSPLADRWRRSPPSESLPHAYTVEGLVSIPSQGEVSVRLVGVRRQASERRYLLDSTDLSLASEGPWQPLERILVLKNQGAPGLGQALPPGPALIYLGGFRGGAYQKALLGHTDPGGEIRINLGPSRGVTASRIADARTPGTAGLPQQNITLKLANALPTAVKVEVLERPPVPLAWDMVRSSMTYERVGQVLRYEGEIEARRELEITYTLRLMEPPP